MSDTKKRKGTQKYLADFRLGDNGKYSYRGTFHVSEEERSVRGHLLKDTVCTVLCCGCWLFMGLLPKEAMADSIFIVLPWLLAALGLILCVPSPVKRWPAKGRLRTYLYKRYISSLRGRSLYLFITFVLSAVSQLLYTLLTDPAGRTKAAVLYFAAAAAAAAASLILFLSARRETPLWQEEQKSSN